MTSYKPVSDDWNVSGEADFICTPPVRACASLVDLLLFCLWRRNMTQQPMNMAESWKSKAGVEEAKIKKKKLSKQIQLNVQSLHLFPKTELAVSNVK